MDFNVVAISCILFQATTNLVAKKSPTVETVGLL